MAVGSIGSVSAGATYLTSKNYLLTDVVFGGNLVTIPQIIPTSNFTLTATLDLPAAVATTVNLAITPASGFGTMPLTVTIPQDALTATFTLAAIPVPASLPIALTGLGLLGLMARRRKLQGTSALAM